MAIIGLGIDIVEIARIQEITIRNGDRLAQRVLGCNEWIAWKKHRKSVRFLAKRFAVKEAAAKALGTGFCNKISFNQFEVLNDMLGKPSLHLYGKAYMLAKKLGVTQLHVTITDERRYACAIVIIEN